MMRQRAASIHAPCFCSNATVLGAGQYQLGRYVANHKALVVIDGVEEECKLVRCTWGTCLRWAPALPQPRTICSQCDPSDRGACASMRGSKVGLE